MKLASIAILFTGVLLSSCAKQATELVPGDELAGTYTGTIHLVSTSPPEDTTASASVLITKTSDAAVNMTITVTGGIPTTLANITVSGTEFPLNLSKTTGYSGYPEGPLTGTLNNKTLNWVLFIDPTSTWTFAGTKP